MFKRLFTLFLALVVGLQPLAASAGDLTSAFSGLLGNTTVSVNQPGRYQSSARNSFIAGGVDLRIPRQNTNNIQLFTFTPPRITAGCGGISAHFGGFSFISSEEFTQLLKNIAQGMAIGFVVQLAMATLCPKCEDIVNKLKDTAQMAARLAIDSCEMGKNLAKEMGFTSSSSSPEEGEPRRVCGTTTSNDGGTMDYLAAVTGKMCKSVKDAVETLMKQTNATTPEAKSAVQCEAKLGNMTWARLKGFDIGGKTGAQAEQNYVRKLLLMNLMGIELKGAGTDASVLEDARCVGEGGAQIVPEPGKMKYCPPPFDHKELVGLYMCGTPTGTTFPGNPTQRIKQYCADYFQKRTDNGQMSGGKIYVCAGDKTLCNWVELKEVGDEIAKGEGFLTQVNKLLTDGAIAVRNNQPLSPDLIRLMQVAPVPLYQAVNAAAVYPSSALDLLDSMSILVAEQIAYSYFDEMLRLEGRSADGSQSCLDPASAKAIVDTLSNIRSMSLGAKEALGRNMAVQQALNEQIRRINLVIQQQVLSQDLLASSKWSQQMTKTITSQPTSSVTGAPAAP